MTPQRQAYLDARGHTILSACPGSGKTTSIVKKLMMVSRYCEESYGKHTGFACLSFTNKACAEIKLKFREIHDVELRFPNEVLTIDSFIMQYVVLPFWYLCDACKKKPIVVNEAEILERVYYFVDRGGGQQPFSVLGRQYAGLMHRKTPSLVSRDKNVFRWNNNIVSNPSEVSYCRAAFAYRLGKGYITSGDALWIACDILEHYQDVGRALITRFPYIIVDEAQDNSELHFEFFNLLKRAGLENLEFVGDICQSIYGFNNARPELLQNLMGDESWRVIHLTECRRSNQRIIDLYSKLKSSDVPSIISHGVEDKNIPIVIYKYGEANISEILKDFNHVCSDNELSSKIVLARGVNKCKLLAGVKDVNFRYWKKEQPLPYLIIDAIFAYSSGDLDYAFRKMRHVLSELLAKDDVESKRAFIHKIENDLDWNSKIFGFLKVVPPFSLSYKEWSEQTCILLQSYWELDKMPVFVPYQKKEGYKMENMANVPVERYHLSNNQGSEYHKSIETIHAVKGATMDAVLLFLSSDSRGQNISLNDFPRTPPSIMTEGQRLIYVACSRATQFLALAVPVSTSDDEIRDVLSGINVDIRHINLQGEFALF